MVSSLLMSFAPATVRVYATTAKGGGAKEEEKNPLDFVLGFMTKQDQFYETDPILKKVEEKQGTSGSRGGTQGTSGSRGGTQGTSGSRGGTVRGGKTSAPTPVPPKKNDGGFGGLGGLFNKK